MPKYVIERPLPGADNLSPSELQAMAERSNSVLRELGPTIQWLHSYVAENKIYCVYIAANPEIILEHARCAGFPAETITRVATVIDPTTAER
jgi:hypothetical protein